MRTDNQIHREAAANIRQHDNNNRNADRLIRYLCRRDQYLRARATGKNVIFPLPLFQV